jgi:hypothetical protein
MGLVHRVSQRVKCLFELTVRRAQVSRKLPGNTAAEALGDQSRRRSGGIAQLVMGISIGPDRTRP